MKLYCEIKRKHRFPVFAGACVFLFSFAFQVSDVYAGNETGGKDSSKVYALDDPRNPDCPCHKYQQLADKEYALLQGKTKKSSGAETSETNKYIHNNSPDNHLFGKSHRHRGRYWKHTSKKGRHHRIKVALDKCWLF